MIEQRVGPKHLSIAIQRAVSEGAGMAANNAASGGDAPNNGDSKDEENGKSTDDKKSADEEGDAGAENSNASGKPANGATSSEPLTTLSFLKTVKTIAGAAGQDLTKSFLTSWIIEPGMPFFTVGYWYNRKQTQAEVVLQQEIPLEGSFTLVQSPLRSSRIRVSTLIRSVSNTSGTNSTSHVTRKSERNVESVRDSQTRTTRYLSVDQGWV
ncbi:hypothetical protein AM588_10002516 [Phytophthora nicotianae]|uniref:Uncharacterized protein n=1 Tax=Phytophthora nicotianae TaxID=4792 RepID=A0A0W8CQI2_PHYNI|nr:hypothetical protein AM588_10002516 [Phytophthora nicotianae]